MRRRHHPHRKSIRLKGWDYSNPGLYFVTANTKNRVNHFGSIRNGIMGLSIHGCLVHYYWNQIPDQFEGVELDEFIAMPDHIHGIVAITGGDIIPGVQNDEQHDNPDAMNRLPTDSTGTIDSKTKPNNVGSPIYRNPNNSNKPKQEGGVTGKHNPMVYKNHLGRIMRWFKGRCTYEIRDRDYVDFAWQSRFYDHIIRNEKELGRIRKYIYNNPLNWQMEQDKADRVHEQAVEYMVQG